MSPLAFSAGSTGSGALPVDEEAHACLLPAAKGAGVTLPKHALLTAGDWAIVVHYAEDSKDLLKIQRDSLHLLWRTSLHEPVVRAYRSNAKLALASRPRAKLENSRPWRLESPWPTAKPLREQSPASLTQQSLPCQEGMPSWRTSLQSSTGDAHTTHSIYSPRMPTTRNKSRRMATTLQVQARRKKLRLRTILTRTHTQKTNDQKNCELSSVAPCRTTVSVIPSSARQPTLLQMRNACDAYPASVTHCRSE